eukprot:2759861-Pyramimonas_sp.AAC.1
MYRARLLPLGGGGVHLLPGLIGNAHVPLIVRVPILRRVGRRDESSSETASAGPFQRASRRRSRA